MAMLVCVQKWQIQPTEFWELSYPMYIKLTIEDYKAQPNKPMSRKLLVEQERKFNRKWSK